MKMIKSTKRTYKMTMITQWIKINIQILKSNKRIKKTSLKMIFPWLLPD